MGRKRKEEICEDCCFNCKDGGYLMICDYKNCLKAYHPECVGKDDAFVESGERWTCNWHSCFLCQKSAKFYCFCCPRAVCAQCIHSAEFALVKVKKGFCVQCLRLAVLIENGSSVDPDGVTVDFNEQSTYECYFLSYWEIVKKKEGLTRETVRFADNLLKKGKNYDSFSLQTGNLGPDISESEDESLLVSDYDDSEEIEEYKPGKKRSASKKKLHKNTMKRKVESKKMEFIGWGSKTLLEFLAFVGKDSKEQMSQHEVASLVIDYCKENQLFDPKKKKKIICDARLHSLFRRKFLFRNRLVKLLDDHFAENFEQSKGDRFWSSMDDVDEKVKRQRNLGTVRETKKTKVTPNVQKSCFASVNAENIKLVYLKRSLVEELLKQPETFDRKVVGSFVRVKCDPNDYLQKNSHQLLQVKGVKTSSNGQMTAETVLQFFNFPVDYPICKLSDDNFTEEECEDLCNRVKNGMLKRPTVTELEQKARTLHEDITKHWISRELALLRRRIDQANEKGWRRDLVTLSGYMDRTQMLSDPLEQSRLLTELPEVIADIEELDPVADIEELDCIVQDSPIDDRSECNSLPDSHIPDSPDTDLGIGMSSSPTDKEELEPVVEDSAVDDRDERNSLPESHILQTLNTDLGIGMSAHPTAADFQETRNRRSEYEGLTSEERKRTLSVEIVQLSDDEPCNVPETRDQRSQCEGSASKERQGTLRVEVVELSDDEGDNAENGQQTLDNSVSSLWYVMGPHGEIMGPKPMSLLKLWVQTVKLKLKYKVWEQGKRKEEAILLEDAIRRFF